MTPNSRKRLQGDDWWPELPSELLQKIVTKLVDISDYVRLRAVGRSWRAALPLSDPQPIPHQLPWLIASRSKTVKGTLRYLALPPSSLFGPRPRRRLPRHQLLCGRLRLPDANKRSVCGSSHGWLILKDHSAPTASLLNPTTGARVILPPLPTKVRYDWQNPMARGSMHLSRIILAASLSGWFVMASFISTKAVAFWRPGDDAWTTITYSFRPPMLFLVESFTYHKGRFYIVLGAVKTIVFDGGSCKEVLEVQHPLLDHKYHYRYRLVESSSGELLLVADCRRECDAGRERFYVFQLEQGEEPSWLRVRDIGDSMLFLDSQHCFSMDSSGFTGYRGNCIYFTKKHSKTSSVCLFDIADGTVTELRSFSLPRREFVTWMVPSL